MAYRPENTHNRAGYIFFTIAALRFLRPEVKEAGKGEMKGGPKVVPKGPFNHENKKKGFMISHKSL